jgi:hypothetical protein
MVVPANLTVLQKLLLRIEVQKSRCSVPVPAAFAIGGCVASRHPNFKNAAQNPSGRFRNAAMQRFDNRPTAAMGRLLPLP